MKPSIEEQLQGTCRVLETVVAPHVGEPFARSILDGLIANLRMLIDAIPAVPTFLREDNLATERLLTSLQASLPDELNANLTALRAEPEPDLTNVAALDARNRSLRGLLAIVVRSEGLSSDQNRAIVEHMSQRASRIPMRYVATAQSPPSKEKT